MLITELIVDRSQLFAVSTPWSIELNQDIFSLVESDRLEVLADKNLDGLGIPIIRDLLRVKMFLEISGEVVSSELGEVLLGQIGEIRGVLINTLSQLKLPSVSIE